MKDGIYKLIFDTNVNQNGQLGGIVIVNNGSINGGDDVCFYKGEVKGNKAFVKSVPYNKNDTNAFNGTGTSDLELSIDGDGDHYKFKGHIKNDQSKTISGKITFLSNLA
ncbi:hypothetical protein EH228_04465 [Erwinia endophytica]|uniref:GrlR family regulatory protein n=1 Tax=Erwinia endophytica TaxID=1563158 RepID=UPI001265F743|nr:GrlR family regulatory protein [Erwinia endophytica]KAB8312938.1 hypothetical protein EH228_04465 [Erwinia endophytica]